MASQQPVPRRFVDRIAQQLQRQEEQSANFDVLMREMHQTQTSTSATPITPGHGAYSTRPQVNPHMSTIQPMHQVGSRQGMQSVQALRSTSLPIGGTAAPPYMMSAYANDLAGHATALRLTAPALTNREPALPPYYPNMEDRTHILTSVQMDQLRKRSAPDHLTSLLSHRGALSSPDIHRLTALQHSSAPGQTAPLQSNQTRGFLPGPRTTNSPGLQVTQSQRPQQQQQQQQQQLQQQQQQRPQQQHRQPLRHAEYLPPAEGTKLKRAHTASCPSMLSTVPLSPSSAAASQMELQQLVEEPHKLHLSTLALSSTSSLNSNSNPLDGNDLEESSGGGPHRVRRFKSSSALHNARQAPYKKLSTKSVPDLSASCGGLNRSDSQVDESDVAPDSMFLSTTARNNGVTGSNGLAAGANNDLPLDLQRAQRSSLSTTDFSGGPRKSAKTSSGSPPRAPLSAPPLQQQQPRPQPQQHQQQAGANADTLAGSMMLDPQLNALHWQNALLAPPDLALSPEQLLQDILSRTGQHQASTLQLQSIQQLQQLQQLQQQQQQQQQHQQQHQPVFQHPSMQQGGSSTVAQQFQCQPMAGNITAFQHFPGQDAAPVANNSASLQAAAQAEAHQVQQIQNELSALLAPFPSSTSTGPPAQQSMSIEELIASMESGRPTEAGSVAVGSSFAKMLASMPPDMQLGNGANTQDGSTLLGARQPPPPQLQYPR